MNLNVKTLLAALTALAFAASPAFAAHPGFYIGAGGGETTAKASVDVGTNNFDFDQTDTAWKGFVGYQFLPWLGIEGGYVDLGSPSDDTNILGGTIDGEMEASAWQGFVVASLPIGPVDLFVKGGGANVKLDLKLHDNVSGQTVKGDDNDAMWAYGAGAALNFGHFTIRGEYEAYDVDTLDDLYVVSGSLIYRFFREKPKAVPVAAPTPAPAPPPKPAPVVAAKCADGDNDGVCDAVDQCPDTPAGKRVGISGCDCDYTLRTHFAFGSAELTAEDKAQLDELARVLLNPKLNFVAGIIEGHTDNVGNPEYNIGLSKRRAEAVANYLKSKGVQLGDRFTTQGFGASKPIADNATAEGRAQNRRASIHRTDCDNQ